MNPKYPKPPTEIELAIRQLCAARREAFLDLRRAGWTLEQIGRHYGVSRQRVFQVLRAGNGQPASPAEPTPALGDPSI